METGLSGDVGLSQEANGAGQDTFNMAFYGGHWAFYSEKEFDEISIMAFLAIEDGESLFITGKAGTGKTTLLEKFVEINDNRPVSLKKNITVVAPTGVAAENAKGMTIHHFFSLPPLTYLPEYDNHTERYNLSEQMQEFVRNLDTLIIDEISMVRCDLLDAVDDILRHYRENNKPFGGVQLLMFGDLYQLSPVAESDDEELLVNCYDLCDQYYFFCSHALQKLRYRIIELQKIYRQGDPVFKDLLNRVRVGDVCVNDLKELRKRYGQKTDADADSDVLTLTVYNKNAYAINMSMYSKLCGKEYTYDARKSGKWIDVPADDCLKLKVGARVMFLRNSSSGEYKNGTMGKVDALYDDYIDVLTDGGKLVHVSKAKWERYEYKLDKKNKVLQRNVSATFEQFPLKLAWAVSIHKSQGLTFDNVVIDACDAFASGQVYVALSRCRTLEGIRLCSQIHLQDIIIDPVIGEYLKCVNNVGWVCLPSKFEFAQFENKPLVLNVKKDTFLYGVRKHYPYRHSIDNRNKEKLLVFVDGKLCINKTFSKVEREWSFTDVNDGDFPFVLRQYKKVIFRCEGLKQQVDVEMQDRIRVYVNRNNVWAFEFRIKNVGVPKPLEPESKLTAPMTPSSPSLEAPPDAPPTLPVPRNKDHDGRR